MKKLLLIIALTSTAIFSAKADEGMWLLPLIQKMNGKAMKELGCELTPKQIYDINNTSLKDAIVQFGGGCTGEIISSEGLLVTNHHCGYGNIQKLSSVEHDYLKDGFWAMNRSEELPNKGLTVRFLDRMEDVTGIILKGYDPKMTEEERVALVKENSNALISEVTKDGNGIRATVEALYYGNQYFLFLYREYSDIRLVGAPPSSIGKFGGDTDNWMWPRHTGDFSMFRIYAKPDGTPAEYSEDNVPLKTPGYAPVSIKGHAPGDYCMTIGYPGRTNRYLSSWGIVERTEATNQAVIDVRTAKQNVWKHWMDADRTIELKYSSKWASSSNYWKNSIGMNKAIVDNKVVETKLAEEAAFKA